MSKRRDDEPREVGTEHLPLFEQPAPLHRDARPTERAAAEKITRKLGTLRRRVYDLFVLSRDEGMTPDEVCEAIPDVTPYSLRPRVTELEQHALIRDTGRTRENRRGNAETVFVVSVSDAAYWNGLGCSGPS